MIISSCTPLRLFFPFYLFIYPDYYFLSHYVKKNVLCSHGSYRTFMQQLCTMVSYMFSALQQRFFKGVFENKFIVISRYLT